MKFYYVESRRDSGDTYERRTNDQVPHDRAVSLRKRLESEGLQVRLIPASEPDPTLAPVICRSGFCGAPPAFF